MVSVPASAPTCPPETGASTIVWPSGTKSAANSRTSDGATVEQSTTVELGSNAAATPSPKRTCRACAGVCTITITRSQPDAAFAAVSQATPPLSANFARDCGNKSNPRSAMPARRILRAMPCPIIPKPMNAVPFCADINPPSSRSLLGIS